MEYSEKVVDVLSKAVVSAVNQRLAEYDVQLDKKLSRYVFGSKNIMPLAVTGEQIATGTIVGENILGLTITGDLIANGTLTGVKIENGTISTEKLIAEEVTTAVMNAVIANIATADIDWANVNTINADSAIINTAVINELKAEKAEIGELVAALADVGTAIIKDATIDAAHIKNLDADIAIFQQAASGQMFIGNLSTSSISTVLCLADALVLPARDEDGKVTDWYQLIVNPEFDPDIPPEEKSKLPILTKKVAVEGGAIVDGTVSNDALVANAITVSKLNVDEIVGNEAFLVSLTSGMVTTGQMFANEAFIGALKTHLIQSDYLTIKIQDEIARKDGVNLLPDSSKDEIKVTANGGAMSQIGTIAITSESPVKSGDNVVFRTHLRPMAQQWRALIAFTYPAGVTPSAQSLIPLGLTWVNGVGAVKYSDRVVVSTMGDWTTVTSVIPPDVNGITIYLQNTGTVSDFCYYHSPKLEEGTVPTSDYFDPENWKTIRNTVMTFDSQGIRMEGGLIHLVGGSMELESDTALMMNAGSELSLHGAIINLYNDIDEEGTETGSQINIRSGGAINIFANGEMQIQSGGKMTLLSGSDLEMQANSNMVLKAGSKLSLIGADIEIASESQTGGGLIAGGITIKSGSNLTIESGGNMAITGGIVDITAGSMSLHGSSSLHMAGGDITLGSFNTDGTVKENGNLYVQAGEIDIQSKGSFKVSTGGKFSVDANDDSSYIRFGGSESNPNFILGNQGVIKAVSGSFERLMLNGDPLISAVGGSLTDKIIVSETEPTQRGVIWVHPLSSPTPVAPTYTDYNYTATSSAQVAFNGNPASNNVIFTNNGEALAGDQCSYGIKFRIYSWNANAGQSRVTVTLQRQSGGNSITIINNMPIGWVGNGGYFDVNTLNDPSPLLENMTDSPNLRVTITIYKSNSTFARFEYGSYTLRCKSSNEATAYSLDAGESQSCEIFYLP